MKFKNRNLRATAKAIITWKEMKIGDHVYKNSMNPFGLVNGNEKLFVEKRYWFGLRGIFLAKSAK